MLSVKRSSRMGMDASNWSTDLVPLSTEEVEIDGNYNVYIDDSGGRGTFSGGYLK